LRLRFVTHPAAHLLRMLASMSTIPPSDRALPELVGESPPEHDLRGRMLVLMLYACGGAAFLGMAMLMRELPPAQRPLLLLFGGFFFAVAAFIAEGFRRFECWAWFFVMGWLVLPVGFVLMAPYELREVGTPAAIGFGTFIALWMHYLWSRRWQFWSDPRIAPPPRRRVTPEWRAGRLARMAADASAARAARATAAPRTVRRAKPISR
jgi:hypothetical protein